MARASYQNLSRISFGSPRQTKVIKKPKKPKKPKAAKPTVSTPTIMSIPHKLKPILRLKY
jgi:hypothetical protein